ncbi:MAG: tRNA lysidine(34) synthetase TilS [Patescibacteria group bacterium]
MKNQLIKKLQNYIFSHNLFQRGEKVLVGFSGGPDSTCLTLVLAELADKYDLELHLVHINYHQRGEDSDKDEKFAVKMARKLDIPIEVVHFSYEEGQEKGNLEERMREFRYKVFEEKRRENLCNWIAVGHTLDDKVETFMMNLIRGAGIKGLISLKNKRGKIIRPLLGIDKKEIDNYLKERGQIFRVDKSNFDTKFFRNRVRIELLPLIEKKYNPGFKKRVEKLIENLESEDRMAEEFIEGIYPAVVKLKRDKAILNSEEVQELPPEALKRIFRKALVDILGDLNNITANHFLEFKKVIFSQKSKKQEINLGRVLLEKKKNRVILKKQED